MPSKMVMKRQKSAADVEEAILSHSQEAQNAVTAFFTPYLGEGEAPPDVTQLQELCSRLLERHRKEIVEADEAHLAETRDDPLPRIRRDAAAAALVERLTLIRDNVGVIVGPVEGAALLGIDGPMDRDPVVLARKTRRALDVIQAEDLEMPPSRLEGIVVDPRPWVAGLEGPLQELESALKEVTRSRRTSESTLIAKQEALEEYDRVFLRVARLQEALFRVAGLDRLADRVRPSKRRPGQTVNEAEGGTSEEPVPSEPATEGPSGPPVGPRGDFDPLEAPAA